MNSRRNHPAGRRFACLLLAMAAAVPGCQPPSASPPAHLRDLPAVAAFELTDAQGQPFTRDELDGQVWVVNFFFTRCPTICPPLMAEMDRVAQRWAGDEDVRLLSITVDAGHDRPEILRDYAREQGLHTGHWTLATGDPDAIVALSEQSFLQALSRERDAQGDILHSSRALVLDRRGRLRGWYDLFDEDDHLRLDVAVRWLLDHGPLPAADGDATTGDATEAEG